MSKSPISEEQNNKQNIPENLPSPKNKGLFKFTLAVLVFVAILFLIAVKFWNTGTLNVGGYYINGWTPFNNLESYFYFGKYNRETAWNNITQSQIPTPALKKVSELNPSPFPSPKPTTEPIEPIIYELKTPVGWDYGTNAWGESVIKKGNPYCNCSYECYGIDEYCKHDEINTYGEISLSTSNFCKTYEKFFPNEKIKKNCGDITIDDFTEYKDTLFPSRNVDINEKEGCGPFGVAGPASIVKVSGLTAITQYDDGESCRYPSDKVFYIYLPALKSGNLLEISTKNYNLYKTEIDKALSTLKILDKPF